MLRPALLSFLVPICGLAQETDINLYRKLQEATKLPLIEKATPPNRGYEARLYGKSGESIYIIRIVASSGSDQFFSFDSKAKTAKSIQGARVVSNGLNILFKKKAHQFICSYAFYVVD